MYVTLIQHGIHNFQLLHCRTPVVIALCGLFELASDVDTETRHANNVSHFSTTLYSSVCWRFPRVVLHVPLYFHSFPYDVEWNIGKP